jgi:hypothetical protein
MLKFQYCVLISVQFTGHPLFVTSSQSIPVTISGAEMQSCSLLEVRQLFCVFCVVTRVHGFDVRLVTNDPTKHDKGKKGHTVQDSWF